MPKVYSLTDEILVAEYELHTVVHLADVREELDKRLAIKNAPHLLLVKLHGLADFGEDAKFFLHSGEHVSKTKAAAIVCDVNSGYYEQGKILLQSVLCLDKLRFPVKLFDNEIEAVRWLEDIGING